MLVRQQELQNDVPRRLVTQTDCSCSHAIPVTAVTVRHVAPHDDEVDPAAGAVVRADAPREARVGEALREPP